MIAYTNPNFGTSFDSAARIIARFFSLASIAIVFALTLRTYNSGGWDVWIYCESAQLASKHINIYETHSAISKDAELWPYPAPPLTTIAASVVCAYDGLVLRVFYATLLIICIPVLLITSLYQIALFICGFGAVWSAFIAGNMACAELLLLSLAFYLIQKQDRISCFASGAVLGLTAFIKIQFAPIAVLFFLWRRQLATFISFFATFVGLWLVSLILFPQASFEFFSLIFKELASPGEFVLTKHSYPGLTSVFRGLLDFISFPFLQGFWFPKLLIYSAAICVLRKRSCGIGALYFAVLIVSLVLPRYVHYALVCTLPALIFASKSLSNWRQLALIFFTCLMPVVFEFDRIMIQPVSLYLPSYIVNFAAYNLIVSHMIAVVLVAPALLKDKR